MTITSFDRHNCRLIHTRVQTALKALGDELSLTFEQAGGKFDPSSFTMKIRADVKRPAPVVEAAQRMAFAAHASWFGLTAADYGRVIHLKGVAYKITGINPGAPKFPIVAERVYDKKSFRLTAGSVKTAPARVAA